MLVLMVHTKVKENKKVKSMKRKQTLVGILNNHIVDYPTPGNLSYFWSFGSLAGLCLVMQIITGILLAMHYTPHVDLAFASTEHIMRDVNNGWLLRYGHANGASMFFIIVYVHIARGLYYGSYMKPRHHLWGSGVLIFFLMMATGFMGYVLPWGQMSFWGVTVITNLFSAIPVVGPAIVEWLWGGFSVDNPTLNRFFSLHYLLPFIIAAVAGLHLVLLHQHGSNNPLGIDSSSYKISFYPYFYVKDLFSFLCFILFFSVFVYYYPNVLGHPDNYIQADPLKTPPHVVPEWYYLPFYAILRSIPDKLGGVVAMGGAVAMLATLPYVNTGEIRSSVFRPIYRILFWIFVVNVLSLTVIGQIPVKEPFVTIGQVCTLLYFGYFLSLPLIAKLESHLNK
jgi:quinol-cytochrome oxidoreductase complex cytochrome b subunit